MLFSAEAKAFVKDHFICMLSDHPDTRGVRRHPEIWEAWEGGILWVCNPDQTVRKTFDYREMKSPARFMVFLKSALAQGGVLTLDPREKSRLAVVERLLAPFSVHREVLRGRLKAALGTPDEASCLAAMNALDALQYAMDTEAVCTLEEAEALEKALPRDAGERIQSFRKVLVGIEARLKDLKIHREPFTVYLLAYAAGPECKTCLDYEFVFRALRKTVALASSKTKRPGARIAP